MVPPKAGGGKGGKGNPRLWHGAAASVAQPPYPVQQPEGAPGDPPKGGKKKKVGPRKKKKKAPDQHARQRFGKGKGQGGGKKGAEKGSQPSTGKGAAPSPAYPQPAAQPRRVLLTPASRAQAAAGGWTTGPVDTWKAVTPNPQPPWNQGFTPGGWQRQKGYRGKRGQQHGSLTRQSP